jgi:hypothetical protein
MLLLLAMLLLLLLRYATDRLVESRSISQWRTSRVAVAVLCAGLLSLHVHLYCKAHQTL